MAHTADNSAPPGSCGKSANGQIHLSENRQRFRGARPKRAGWMPSDWHVTCCPISMSSTTSKPIKTARYSELKRILEDRRCQIQSDVQNKIRGVQDQGTWGGHLHEVLDGVEASDADVQEDIEFAVIQMKSETLSLIDEALDRLRDGDYGFCFECGAGMSEKRLRALPFAARCKPCAESQEAIGEQQRFTAASSNERGCAVRLPGSRGLTRHITGRSRRLVRYQRDPRDEQSTRPAQPHIVIRHVADPIAPPSDGR